MNNQELIHKFYTSFSNGDATEMVSCYHPEIVFEDPAFGILKGEAAKAMWKMLLSNSKNGLRIKYQDVIANEHTGSAYWIADYLFSQTGRPVNNHIHASFEFKDGLIYKHKDDFNLWKWSRQALGTPGLLLGWSAYFKKSLQKRTNTLLKKYMEQHNVQ